MLKVSERLKSAAASLEANHESNKRFLESYLKEAAESPDVSIEPELESRIASALAEEGEAVEAVAAAVEAAKLSKIKGHWKAKQLAVANHALFLIGNDREAFVSEAELDRSPGYLKALAEYFEQVEAAEAALLINLDAGLFRREVEAYGDQLMLALGNLGIKASGGDSKEAMANGHDHRALSTPRYLQSAHSSIARMACELESLNQDMAAELSSAGGSEAAEKKEPASA